MYGPLAFLVVATAGFAPGLVWWRVHRRPTVRTPGGVDLEQVQGFVYVGSGALLVLGIGVIVLGAAGKPGEAEAMAALGLIAYLVYLVAAVLLIRRTSLRAARRSAGWTQPPTP